MAKTKKPALQKVKTIGVIGAGQMGKGIAQVCAQTGYHVIVVEPYEEMLKKSQITLVALISFGKWLTRKAGKYIFPGQECLPPRMV